MSGAVAVESSTPLEGEEADYNNNNYVAPMTAAPTATTESSDSTDTGHAGQQQASARVVVEDVAPHLTNDEKMAQAKRHLRDDQVLAASRLLQSITTTTTNSISTSSTQDDDKAFQQEVERKTHLITSVVDDLLTHPSEHWIKMGESHSDKRDTIQYYQITEDLQLKCRLETPIESSLLVPLLSVLNETDLFTTWMPSWNYPNLGLESVDKIAQMGRTEQTVQFISRVPWPFPQRDVFLQTLACDDIHDIEGQPTTGTIAIALHSLLEGDEIRKSTVAQDHYKECQDVLTIPPCPEGMKRAEFEGGLLFRQCPDDHITLQGSTINYPPDQHLILVGFSMRVDGKISPRFPTSIINFVISTVISAMWQKFLDIAEEIRAGNRPQHAEAIARKRGEIYDWVDARVDAMFAQLHNQQQQQESEEGTAGSENNDDEL